jgi:hypothetical protein
VTVDSIVFGDDGIGVVRYRGEQPRVLPWASVTAHVVERWVGGAIPDGWVNHDRNGLDEAAPSPERTARAKGSGGHTGRSGGLRGRSGGLRGRSGGLRGRSGGLRGRSGGLRGRSDGNGGRNGAHGGRRGARGSGGDRDPAGGTGAPVARVGAGALISIRTPYGSYRFLFPGGDPAELSRRVAAFAVRHQGPTGASTVTRVVAWGQDIERRQSVRPDPVPVGWARVRPILTVLLVVFIGVVVTLILLQSAGTIHLPLLGGSSQQSLPALRIR